MTTLANVNVVVLLDTTHPCVRVSDTNNEKEYTCRVPDEVRNQKPVVRILNDDIYLIYQTYGRDIIVCKLELYDQPGPSLCCKFLYLPHEMCTWNSWSTEANCIHWLEAQQRTTGTHDNVLLMMSNSPYRGNEVLPSLDKQCNRHVSRYYVTTCTFSVGDQVRVSQRGPFSKPTQLSMGTFHGHMETFGDYVYFSSVDNGETKQIDELCVSSGRWTTLNIPVYAKVRYSMSRTKTTLFIVAQDVESADDVSPGKCRLYSYQPGSSSSKTVNVVNTAGIDIYYICFYNNQMYLEHESSSSSDDDIKVFDDVHQRWERTFDVPGSCNVRVGRHDDLQVASVCMANHKYACDACDANERKLNNRMR
jgi:hypothetical protein